MKVFSTALSCCSFLVQETTSGPPVDLTRGTGVFGDDEDDDDAIFANIPEPASSSGAAGEAR